MLIAERSDKRIRPDERYIEQLFELIDTSAQPALRPPPQPHAAPTLPRFGYETIEWNQMQTNPEEIPE